MGKGGGMHVVLLRFSVPAEGAGVHSSHTKAYGLTTALEASLFYEHFSDLLTHYGAEVKDGVDDGPYEVEMITADVDVRAKASGMIEGIIKQAEQARQQLADRDPSLSYTAPR